MWPNNDRRNIRDMPTRRRYLGMTIIERMDERRLYALALSILTIVVHLPAFQIRPFLLLGTLLITIAHLMRTVLWPPLMPVNPRNRNRMINSFTDEECYRDFRWYKHDLHELCDMLGFPMQVVMPNGLSFPGEHALILLLYRSHYPGTLYSLQDVFGREFTQLSRIYNYAVRFIYTNHQHRVLDNVDWYSTRFDMYNEAYRKKIAESPLNPNPGTVPHNLNCLFASLDAQAKKIARPYVRFFAPPANTFFSTFKLLISQLFSLC